MSEGEWLDLELAARPRDVSLARVRLRLVGRVGDDDVDRAIRERGETGERVEATTDPDLPGLGGERGRLL